MASQTLFILVVSTTYCINAQVINCNGGACDCPSTPPSPGALCVLDCSTEDICKGQKLTCRPGDPCEILCEGKASCSSGARIYANGATDLTVICSGHDSCKDDMDIYCGSGHCRLHCDEYTSCENWGFTDVSLSKSFKCVGSYCPNKLPIHFTASPTTYSPTIQTISPTQIPTLYTSSPTINTLNPTKIPTTITISPSKYPTYNPTTTPTKYPSVNPTESPTQNPTETATATPSVQTTMQNTHISTQYTVTMPTFYPSLNPSTLTTANPTQYVSTNIFESSLITETLSDVNLYTNHISHSNTGDSMHISSIVLIILAIALCIVSITLGYVLYSKNRKRKVFKHPPKHVNINRNKHIHNQSPCASKSPSTYAKSIKSAYSTNEQDIGLKTRGDEGSSDSMSCSDDMYKKDNGSSITGQIPHISMNAKPLSIQRQRIASNSTYNQHNNNNSYYYTQPGQNSIPQQPYNHIHSPSKSHAYYSNNNYHQSPIDYSIQHGNFPSVSAISYSYIPGMHPQQIISPILSDLPSISKDNNENGNDILPAIPDNKTIAPTNINNNTNNKQTKNDVCSEFSHVTVTTSNAASDKTNSNNNNNSVEFTLKISPNDEQLEQIVCVDLENENELIELARNIQTDIENDTKTHTKTQTISLTDTSVIKEYKYIRDNINNNNINTNKLYVE